MIQINKHGVNVQCEYLDGFIKNKELPRAIHMASKMINGFDPYLFSAEEVKIIKCAIKEYAIAMMCSNMILASECVERIRQCCN